MTLLDKFGQKIANFFSEDTDLDEMGREETAFCDTLDPDYLADLLPYRIFDEERKIYENKSSLGFVIEVVPILGASLNTQKELSTLVREIGEEGSSLQSLLFADYRINRFLDLWSAPGKQKGGVFDKLTQKRSEFFQKESVEGEVPPRIFRFIFSYSEPKSQITNLPLFLDKLVQKKAKALETFSHFNAAVELQPFQLIELLSGFINFDLDPALHTRKTWNKNTSICKQIPIPGSALEVKKDGLLFHGKTATSLFKTYEAIEFPDTWSLNRTSELIGDFLNTSYRIPSPFFLHYGIFVPHQQKKETHFRLKAKMVDRQAKFSSLVRMFPSIPREREENLFVHQQLLEGEKFVETRFSCGLWAESSSHIKSESILLAIFQKNGFKLKENKFLHLPDFLSSLPMGWGEDASYVKNLKRMRCMRTTLTSETGNLFPFVAESLGNSGQGVILTGRKGQISTWDPFATGGNLNTVVIGASGLGKSVFLQEVIANQLMQDARVFVLDLGRSFEKLCHVFKGQYLAFSEKSNLHLNPFSFVNTSDPDALNSALEMVSSIIATMAMTTEKIDKQRADILYTMVKRAWEKKGKDATVDDVMAFLGEKSFFRSELMIGATESLKESLKKFSQDGVYKNHFYGKDKIDFTSDLVVIETEELKSLADLQAVIFQILILTISNQVFLGNRKRRCFICIDEAWDILKSPQMEGFMGSLARRLRKYNGALLTATQGADDFEKSPGAKAVFQNSNWLVIAGKNEDTVNAFKKEGVMQIDSFKEMALSSLRLVEGKYSELCIYNKGDGSFSVNQLRLDPFSLALYSTKADNFQTLQELKAQGFSVEDAIDWMVTHKRDLDKFLSSGLKVKEALAKLLGGSYVKL